MYSRTHKNVFSLLLLLLPSSFTTKSIPSLLSFPGTARSQNFQKLTKISQERERERERENLKMGLKSRRKRRSRAGQTLDVESTMVETAEERRHLRHAR